MNGYKSLLVLVTVFVVAHAYQTGYYPLKRLVSDGPWQPVSLCPSEKVFGIQIKYNVNTSDVPTGIAIVCDRSRRASNSPGERQWSSSQRCPNKLRVIGYSLQIEPNNTAGANNIAVFCGDGSEPRSKRFNLTGNADRGLWTRAQFCEAGHVVCGIESQSDKPNNVNMVCCSPWKVSTRGTTNTNRNIKAHETTRGFTQRPTAAGWTIRANGITRGQTRVPGTTREPTHRPTTAGWTNGANGTTRDTSRGFTQRPTTAGWTSEPQKCWDCTGLQQTVGDDKKPPPITDVMQNEEEHTMIYVVVIIGVVLLIILMVLAYLFISGHKGFDEQRFFNVQRVQNIRSIQNIQSIEEVNAAVEMLCHH